jgi:hypothetical protein
MALGFALMLHMLLLDVVVANRRLMCQKLLLSMAIEAALYICIVL